MSPECRNCGSFVTESYVRVFSPETRGEGVDACPHCEEMVRRNGVPEEARADRSNPYREVSE